MASDLHFDNTAQNDRLSAPEGLVNHVQYMYKPGDQLPGDKLPIIAPVNGFGKDGLPVLSVDYKGQDGNLSPDDIKHAVREMNHETNGMVEPGKESIALRGANEALLNGDLKKFTDAFRGLSTDERQHVADAMNQAFEKRGSNSRINVDGDGNMIVSNGAAGEETSAAKVNPDTGKVTEVKGKRDGNDFVVTGESTSSDGGIVFQGIGEITSKDLMPDIPTIKTLPIKKLIPS